MKAYARGRKDMKVLISLGLSHTFLVQFTFALGYTRKDRKRSGKSCYLYCKGFNDTLDRHLESIGYERPSVEDWWRVMRKGGTGKVKKVGEGKKAKKHKQADF